MTLRRILCLFHDPRSSNPYSDKLACLERAVKTRQVHPDHYQHAERVLAQMKRAERKGLLRNCASLNGNSRGSALSS